MTFHQAVDVFIPVKISLHHKNEEKNVTSTDPSTFFQVNIFFK